MTFINKRVPSFFQARKNTQENNPVKYDSKELFAKSPISDRVFVIKERRPSTYNLNILEYAELTSFHMQLSQEHQTYCSIFLEKRQDEQKIHNNM